VEPPEARVNIFQYAWSFLTTAANWHGTDGIPNRFLEHFQYSGLALLIGAAIALPLGLLTGHTNRGGLAVTTLANIARALPTLGVLILLVVIMGVKFRAVMIPLVALTIPPILLNTYEGIRGVDPELTDAARGIGLRPWQVLWKAEIPAAMPLILTGLRGGAIQAVATMTLAATASFGGLGRYIIDGLARVDYTEVVGGSTLLVIAAILTLAIFAVLRRVLVSPGIRKQS
jgi:osmoprotectant transport system permease protein